MLWGEGRGEGLCCTPSPHPLPRIEAFPEVPIDRGGEGARHSPTDLRLRCTHLACGCPWPGKQAESGLPAVQGFLAWN